MANNITNIAIFCSGTGSNFKALWQAIADRKLEARIVLCLSNREQCGALDFATRHGIATSRLREASFDSPDAFAAAMLAALQEQQTDVVLLAGYMRKVPPAVVNAYSNRMLNIHPALLPKFGGPGMYGLHVHEAVIAAGEKRSGATIHFVSEAYDEGAILLQGTVPVLSGDTPEQLAERVLACEHRLYPDALELLLERIAGGEQRV